MVFARDSENSGEGLAQLLAAEWVTHAFVPSAALMDVDPEAVDDLEALILLDGRSGAELIARWSDRITVFDGSDPAVVDAAPADFD
jgi:hypothetical protein